MAGPQVIVSVLGNIKSLTDNLDEAGKKTGTFGDKVRDAGKKMTAFATVPIVGFLGAATKAAAEDEAAQAALAETLSNTVGNSKTLVKEVEGYIAAAQKASTFTDDDLRPAFENLVRATNNAGEANKLLGLAMDVAAAKHIDLTTASMAVAKAHEGNFAAVNKLVPGLIDVKDKTLTAEDAMGKLATTFGGSAKAATETAAGKTQMLSRDMGELTESVGTALLPVLDKLLGLIQPVIDKFLTMSSGTQTAIVVVGLLVAAIGPLIGVITSLTAVVTFLAANPIILVIAAIAALAAGVVYAYTHFQTFRDVVDGVINFVRRVIADFVNLWLLQVEIIIGAAARAFGWIPGIGPKLRAAAADFQEFRHNTVDAIAGTTSAADKATAAVDRLHRSLAQALPLGSPLANAGLLGVGTRAAGGPVTAGAPYIVGENGPELFVPGASGAIVPGGAAGGPAAGGGISLTANFYGPQDPAGVARQLEDLLYRYQQQGGTLRFATT